MKISTDSNFQAELDFTNQFLAGLKKCDSTFNSQIKEQHNTIKSIKFATMSDVVGDTFRTRISDLTSGEFADIESDWQGGAFKNMTTNTENLATSLQACIDSKNAIAAAETAMQNAIYQEQEEKNGKKTWVTKHRQPAYDNAVSAKASAEESLKTAVNDSNTYISKFPSFHFKGSASQDSGAAETTSGATMPQGTSKTEDGMILVDEFTYTDEFGETHKVQMLIDPQTGNRIVITDEGYMYVVARDVDVVFDGVMYIDGEATYTFEAPVDTSDPNAVREFLQSQEARDYMTDPKSKNPAEERTFQGDRFSTNEMHTGDGETHTVQIGDDSVTFFTAEDAAADQAFNAWMNEHMNADLFNIENYD